MKWKYHLKELGLDLLLGLAIFLAPAVAAEDFSWSTSWWLVVAGAAARRGGAIVLNYVRRTLSNRTPPE